MQDISKVPHKQKTHNAEENTAQHAITNDITIPSVTYFILMEYTRA